jgi:signal transduction histidine kinase
MDHQAAPHQVGESLEAARQMLRRSRALAHDAIRELRTDNPVRRPEPLAASLQRLVDQWRHSGITGIELITEGAARPVAEALERNLAGIAAEAVTNAVKHGRASTIQVRLRFEPEGIQLQVRDNGTGFDPAEKSRSEAGGFGLVGMRERAEAIGGEFLIHSHRGEGTSITVGLKETGRTGDLARLRLDGTAAITASSPAP